MISKISNFYQDLDTIGCHHSITSQRDAIWTVIDNNTYVLAVATAKLGQIVLNVSDVDYKTPDLVFLPG